MKNLGAFARHQTSLAYISSRAIAPLLLVLSCVTYAIYLFAACHDGAQALLLVVAYAITYYHRMPSLRLLYARHLLLRFVRALSAVAIMRGILFSCSAGCLYGSGIGHHNITYTVAAAHRAYFSFSLGSCGVRWFVALVAYKQKYWRLASAAIYFRLTI